MSHLTKIQFACIGCGQHLRVDAASAGLVVNCPSCHQAVTAPKVGVPRVSHVAHLPRVANPHPKPTVNQPPISHPIRQPRLSEQQQVLAVTQYANPPKTGVATVAMICGLLCWTVILFFLSIPAIICGHVALARAKMYPNHEGKVRAVVGLLAGYVMLVVYVGAMLLYQPNAPPQGAPAVGSVVTIRRDLVSLYSSQPNVLSTPDYQAHPVIGEGLRRGDQVKIEGYSTLRMDWFSKGYKSTYAEVEVLTGRWKGQSFLYVSPQDLK